MFSYRVTFVINGDGLEQVVNVIASDELDAQSKGEQRLNHLSYISFRIERI